MNIKITKYFQQKFSIAEHLKLFQMASINKLKSNWSQSKRKSISYLIGCVFPHQKLFVFVYNSSSVLHSFVLHPKLMSTIKIKDDRDFVRNIIAIIEGIFCGFAANMVYHFTQYLICPFTHKLMCRRVHRPSFYLHEEKIHSSFGFIKSV